MSAETLDIKLLLPEQDLRFLSSGSSKAKHMQAWVDQLPMGNLGEAARQLYELIGELNRLEKLSPKKRFQLIEILRPPIQQVCVGMEKYYLNQPVVLSQKAKEIATYAQALQTHLTTGYKLVAISGKPKIKDKALKQIICIAIHRSVTGMGLILLRCYKLYYAMPRLLWLEIHQLYLLAESLGLLDYEVKDSDFKNIESSNIKDAYIRVLLVAAAQPNKLRQAEIQSLYNALESWTDRVELNEITNNKEIFVYDLDADLPPTYRKVIEDKEKGNFRFIDASDLSKLLQKSEAERSQEAKPDLLIPRDISSALLKQLSGVWGQLTERSFERLPATGEVSICLGLSAMHFFLSDGIGFETQLAGGMMPVSVDEIVSENPSDQEEAFDSYSYDLVNTSPGGYCLEWMGEVPDNLRIGEIIGVQEEGQERWGIGTIRWIKQLAKKGAQFGVELLAPSALPCGTRLIKDDDADENTVYMRTLLLPQLNVIGQPQTLITPNIVFNENYEVLVNQFGEEVKGILRKQLNSTSEFTQYQFDDK